MNIVKNHGDMIKDVVYLLTDEMGAPIIDQSKNACAVFESFLSEGGVVYRVCGPIPSGQEPRKIEYFTRLSFQDEDTAWESCDGDGCQGEDLRFQPDTSTLCAGLRLWKGDGEHRDLLVKVTLARGPGDGHHK